MPTIVDPNSRESSKGANLTEKDYDYRYPDGLNLKPGSELHNFIVDQVMQRARKSRLIMSRRHEEWRTIDKNLRAYVPTKDIEGNKSGPRHFPTIVMPHSYATLETLLTYMSASFLQDPIVKYEGVGPEDAFGAELLTHLIAKHSHKFAHGLTLHTQWRDGFAYGIGAVAPTWTREMGYKTIKESTGFTDWVRGLFIKTGERRARSAWTTLYEGNNLINIDPYRILADPNTSAHEVQDAEFFGWIDRGNVFELLNRERTQTDHIFNAKYLRHFQPVSHIDTDGGRRGGRYKDEGIDVKNNPCDTIWMYIDIIPFEWDLGKSKYPEKWFFGVSGDKVLITAMPLGMNHNMTPVCVCAPDYDGYSLDPPSRLGMTLDIQTVMNFLYSSHLQNIMKVINDMVVVDPSLVNINDLASPKPGKIIRMRRKAWGKGGIDNAIQQLKIQDVTQNHVQDTMFLDNMMKQSTGASDPVQGTIGRRTSRISASEFQGARGSSLSRLQKTARIISMQSVQPMARIFASNTQQFMEDETYVKAVGEWAKVLQEKYGVDIERDRVPIRPNDLIVDYDVVPHDGTIPGSENVETWVDLFTTISQNPSIARNYNVVNIFKHIAHQMGAKNLENFIIKPDEPVQVRSDEEIRQEAERGNLIPVENES